MSRYNLIGLAGYMNTTSSLGICYRFTAAVQNEVNRFYVVLRGQNRVVDVNLIIVSKEKKD